MRVTSGILRYEYDRKDPRLGRHLELDARSLAYAVAEARIIATADWPTPIATLDQGQTGSCTGNAGTYHLAQVLHAAYGDLSRAVIGSYKLAGNPSNDEQFALQVYHQATVKDGFPGVYPPDDTGSSGLGVCRALKADKLVGSYKWATSRLGLATMLQTAGCIIGMPWYQAFFEPNSAGFIDADPKWSDSELAGGHEVYVEALEAWNLYDPYQSVIRFHNSWGNWGDNGCGRMRLSTYEFLKSQIDVKQFRV